MINNAELLSAGDVLVIRLRYIKRYFAVNIFQRLQMRTLAVVNTKSFGSYVQCKSVRGLIEYGHQTFAENVTEDKFERSDSIAQSKAPKQYDLSCAV